MTRIGMEEGWSRSAAIAVIVGAARAAVPSRPRRRRRDAAPPASAPAGEPPAPPASRRARRRREPAAHFKIGYSNGGGVGNGFREEQVCTAKAQCGRVRWQGRGPASSPPQHRCGRPAGGHPRPDRARTSTRSSSTRTIPRRSTRRSPRPTRSRHQDRLGRRLRHRPRHLQPVQQPDQVRRARRQLAVRAARRHGQRLVHPRHRRPPGRQRPRHRLQERAQGLPGHQGRPERRRRVHRLGSGDGHPAHQRLHLPAASTTRSRASGRPAWASRSSTRSRPRTSRSCRSPMPTSVASWPSSSTRRGFPDLKGAAVTNTAAVGGAGVTLALKLLNGETVETSADAPQAEHGPARSRPGGQPDRRGQGELEAWQSVPGMDPLWPLSLSIDGWTTYDPEHRPGACKGAWRPRPSHRRGGAGSAGAP